VPVEPDRLDRPTPYLVMDLDRVAAAYRTFRNMLPDVALHYAMKCNPDPQVLTHLYELGCSFEIASGPELAELRAVGVDPGTVLFSNPVKIWQHVRAAHAAGLWRFAFDSAAELEKLAIHAPGAAVYVRLATAPAGSLVPSEGKFGVDAPAARRLMREAVTYGLHPYGITFHVGSQMTDPAAWEAAIQRSARLMADLRRDGIQVDLLDLGGGFPARYASYTPRLTDFAARIRLAVRRYLPYPVELVAEPGRALVAEAGTMVSRVIGVAERHGTRWVHLDVGAFNGMMEALETGTRLAYPVKDSRGDRQRLPHHVTGPTCDSQDTLLHDAPLSASIAPGDTVYIGSAGAYTTSYASRFNGFDVPAVHRLGAAHHQDPVRRPVDGQVGGDAGAWGYGTHA
jgi:ornithine decarboxylase